MAEKQKVGDKGVGKDAAGSVVAFKGAPTTVATKASPNWWEAWFTAPVGLDWTIVRNTVAFKALKDGEKFLQSLGSALSAAWPTGQQIRKAAEGLGRLKDFEAIDNELWTRGLRFSVAWCAVQGDEATLADWIAKVQEFRDKTPYVDLGPHDAAPLAASMKLRDIAYRLDIAQEDLAKANKNVKEVSARGTSSPAEAKKKAADLEAAVKRRDAAQLRVGSIEAEMAPAYAALRKIESVGIYENWCYGGDKSFALTTGNVRADLKALTDRLLDLDYIKTPVVSKDQDDDDFRRVLKHLVETHVRYFDREGAPNSVGTWDGTFTIGTGMNATGGAGPQFLQELAAPRSARFDKRSFPAIPVARAYLQRRGVALLPMVGDVPTVHVTHFEPNAKGRVLYRVSNRFLPTTAAFGLPIHGGLMGAIVGKEQSVNLAKAAAAVAKADEAYGKKQREHWLAYEYLRRQPQALRAFAAIGTLRQLPAEEDPKKATENYAAAHAFNEAALSTLYDHSVVFGHGSFNNLRLRPLLRRSALTTFLHHFRQWWGTGNVASTMVWAIARRLVQSTHGRIDDLKRHEGPIEMKGPVIPSDAVPHPELVAPVGAIDACDEDDVALVRSFEVDASDIAQVGFARAAWIFTQLSSRSAFWDRADESKDPMTNIRWAISCKIWWEFCYDFALELDPSIGGTAGVPGAAVEQVRTVLDKKLGKGVCPFLPVEPYEDVVERVALRLFDESPWRWDPKYPIDGDPKTTKGTFPKPEPKEFEKLLGEKEFSDVPQDQSLTPFSRLMRAAMYEVDELYIVKFLTEHHLKHANTQVFGSATPFGPPYLKARRYVLALKRDAQEMSMPGMAALAYKAVI